LASGALAERVRQMKARLEADEKDRQLLAAFDHVLEKHAEPDPTTGWGRWSGDYAALKSALAKYGTRVGGRSVKDVAGLLHQRSAKVRDRAVAMLDLCLAVAPLGEGLDQQWLTAVLAEADRNPWRQEVRRALWDQDWEAIEKLVASAEVAGHPPAFLVWLARRLPPELSDAEAALLRRAQRQYPDDFWVNFQLAAAVSRGKVAPRGGSRRVAAVDASPWVNESVRFSTAAVTLRPWSVAAHNNLGIALADAGDFEGAIASYKKAIALGPTFPLPHYNLGNALRDRGDIQGAMAAYREAIARDPNYASPHDALGLELRKRKEAAAAIDHFQKAIALAPTNFSPHYHLGLMLYDKRDFDGAIAEFHKAIALKPGFADSHYSLGLALRGAGEPGLAISAYRQAIALDPGHYAAHDNLGNLLANRGDLEGAITAYRTAIGLNPHSASPHNNLGTVLYEKHDFTGAIVAFRNAIELDPHYLEPRRNLGNALKATGDLEGAAAAYRAATQLAPADALSHFYLGLTLMDRGQFPAALEPLQRAHELGSKRPGWRQPSAAWLRSCRDYLKLDARLSAILEGGPQPSSAFDRLNLAQLCLKYRKRYLLAARYFTEGFDGKPPLTPGQQADLRAAAARAAALAAAGKGVDAAKLSDEERASWRRQALSWLREALKEREKELAGGSVQASAAAQKELERWTTTPDLATVRDPDGLANLPAAERAAWQTFWADVAALRKGTAAGGK
jgi:tetratricopeptide (TPR) repeat protein